MQELMSEIKGSKCVKTSQKSTKLPVPGLRNTNIDSNPPILLSKSKTLCVVAKPNVFTSRYQK